MFCCKNTNVYGVLFRIYWGLSNNKWCMYCMAKLMKPIQLEEFPVSNYRLYIILAWYKNYIQY